VKKIEMWKGIRWRQHTLSRWT